MIEPVRNSDEFLLHRKPSGFACANTKRTPKEKAISYLENKAKKHESADTYDTVDNSFGEDIDKAIDIALEEHAIQLFNDLDNVRITNDSFGEPHIFLKTCIDYIEKKKKWLK